MDDSALAIGRVIAEKYRLDAVLGVGGMGAVFRATQLTVNRPVAVKLIQGPLLRHPEVEKRFRREAEAMGRLRHPSTVRLYDFGATSSGELYMVMELLEGRDLAAQLAQAGALSASEALRIAKQILLALDEAHAQGIIHRDLKPANVFLAELHGGEIAIKVMDFGIAGIEQAAEGAKLTRTGAVLGTPAYMSPEQAQGHAIDGRSDLYALGVLIFEMVTGRVPFTADSAVSLLLAQITRVPPRLLEVLPGSPELVPIQTLLDALLHKTPEGRPNNASAALAMVERLLSAVGGGDQSMPTALQLGASGNARRLAEPTGVRLPPTPPTHGGTSLTALAIGSPRAKRIVIGALSFAALVAIGWSLGGDRRAPPAPPLPLQRESTQLHSVSVSSSPSAATVLLDGVVLGVTPYHFEFRKAQTLQLVLAGYVPQSLQVSDSSEPNTVVQLVPIASGEASPRIVAERTEPAARTRPTRRAAQGAGPEDTRPSAAEEPAPAVVQPAAEKPNAPSAPASSTAATYSLSTQPSAHSAAPAARPAAAAPAAKPQSISEAMRNVAAAVTQRVSSATTSNYRNVADAKRAYRAKQIDERRYEDNIRALKQWRNERIKAEKLNLKARQITRDEYDRRVDRIDAEYAGT